MHLVLRGGHLEGVDELAMKGHDKSLALFGYSYVWMSCMMELALCAIGRRGIYSVRKEQGCVMDVRVGALRIHKPVEGPQRVVCPLYVHTVTMVQGKVQHVQRLSCRRVRSDRRLYGVHRKGGHLHNRLATGIFRVFVDRLGNEIPTVNRGERICSTHNHDAHAGGGRVAVGILDGVREGVGKACIGVRRVHHVAIRREHGGSMLPRLHRHHGEGVSIGVGVVGEHVDVHLTAHLHTGPIALVVDDVILVNDEQGLAAAEGALAHQHGPAALRSYDSHLLRQRHLRTPIGSGVLGGDAVVKAPDRLGSHVRFVLDAIVGDSLRGLYHHVAQQLILPINVRVRAYVLANDKLAIAGEALTGPLATAPEGRPAVVVGRHDLAQDHRVLVGLLHADLRAQAPARALRGGLRGQIAHRLHRDAVRRGGVDALLHHQEGHGDGRNVDATGKLCAHGEGAAGRVLDPHHRRRHGGVVHWRGDHDHGLVGAGQRHSLPLRADVGDDAGEQLRAGCFRTDPHQGSEQRGKHSEQRGGVARHAERGMVHRGGGMEVDSVLSCRVRRGGYTASSKLHHRMERQVATQYTTAREARSLGRNGWSRTCAQSTAASATRSPCASGPEAAEGPPRRAQHRQAPW
eukprot:scaffold596_cov378-Prasinococcus_capsulatus_cf.AAC.9